MTDTFAPEVTDERHAIAKQPLFAARLSLSVELAAFRTSVRKTSIDGCA